MHQLRAADAVVGRVSIGLQNAVELFQEAHGPSRPRPMRNSKTAAPPGDPYCQSRLKVPRRHRASAHHRRLISLDVTAAD